MLSRRIDMVRRKNSGGDFFFPNAHGVLEVNVVVAFELQNFTGLVRRRDF
jgi:hypothetical protein